jgi:acetoin utilization deacetylase AcuC-like enzyme
MAKYRRLRERLVEERILAPEDLSVPEPIGWDDLRLAHDDDYIDAVRNGTLTPDAQRRIGFPWSPMMVERSRRSVGATLAACRAALCSASLSGSRQDGGPNGTALHVSANLAGGTHHAFRDHGEGYCVFNDVAVAARVLLRDGLVQRALVVDCDVHQGNGTAAIFRTDPSVFTLSFHGDKNYPLRKEQSDLDVIFADGADDDDYLRALAAHVPRVLDDREPDLVFYLAGADPYEGDRLGRLKLTIAGLRARDRFVLTECSRRGVPVAIAMSGGYANDVDAIVTIHVNTIREAVNLCRPAFAF